MYFGQGQELKLNTKLSEKAQYSRNQANKNSLKEAILSYVNKWGFTFKIKLCVFPVIKKVIRIFNAQPVKIPLFKNPLTCKHLMFISWMLITPSFKKNW